MTVIQTSDSIEHWECLEIAAVGVFHATCGVDLVVRDGQAESHEGVVIAVISIVGGVEWTIFIGLPQQTAEAMAAKFAGFEIPFDSPDMGDAIGELTNILAGEVKAQLDSKGVKAEISLPSVMRAANMHVLIQRDWQTRKYCFDSEAGPLWAGIVAGGGNAAA